MPISAYRANVPFFQLVGHGAFRFKSLLALQARKELQAHTTPVKRKDFRSRSRSYFTS